MFNLFLGALAVAGLFLLINHTRSQELDVTWWQWVLTILGLIFAVFTVEVIAAFYSEGEVQAALVMGLIFGMITVIWGVLLGRFVYLEPESS